jgi:dTDP-4-amino-4,6-dideoxygalactose transaminase
MGPMVDQFESEIAKITNAYCLVVSSGTAALHCSYRALDIKPGDEIITPANTFIATQTMAMHFGAKIRFADINLLTGNMDLSSAKSLINPKTKAITIVDYAGQTPDLDAFRKLCDENNIFLIEDASHSFGSKYKKKYVGSIADLTTFSFFPTKNITTGEGGAVVSKNPILIEKAKLFARQGIIRNIENFKTVPDGAWHYEVQELGLNYRIPDILCAIGLSQIKKIEKFKSIRSDIYNFYSEKLSGLPHLSLPIKETFSDPMWHFYSLRIKSDLRNKLYDWFLENRIKTQINYRPVFLHPLFQNMGYENDICPIAQDYYAQQISLPLHVNLKAKDLNKVIKSIKKFLLTHKSYLIENNG